MKALVIAPQPFFSARGTPFSVYYRTRMTAELGVEIDLLTYGEGQDVEIPGVRIIRIPRFRFLGPVPIGPSLLKAFLDVFIVLWTVRLLLTNRYTFVHAHEESVFFCRYLKPVFGFKLIYDMHSSLPQQMRNFEFTTSRPLIGLFQWLEDSCLKAADAVITICPALADYATSIMPDPRRHFLIENTLFDEVRLAGEQHAATDDAEPIQVPFGVKRIVYAGTFEAYQGLEILLQGFARVRSRLPETKLLLIGGRAEQVEALRRRCDELQIAEDCIIHQRIPPHQARQYVQSAHLIVSPRVHGTNTPLKIYEALARGAVLVATRIPSHTQVLNDEVAFLVDPEPQAFGEGIVAALEDHDRRTSLSSAAKQLFSEQYSSAVYRDKMVRLLETIAAKTPCAA